MSVMQVRGHFESLRNNFDVAVGSAEDAVIDLVRKMTPQPIRLPHRLMIDSNYAPAVMEEVFEDGNGHAHSVGSKAWYQEANRAAIDVNKWAEYLNNYPRDRSVAFLDWEDPWRQRIIERDRFAIACGRTTIDMAKVLRPDLQWAWYGVLPIGAMQTHVDECKLLHEQADFIVVSTYLPHLQWNIETAIDWIKLKIKAALEFSASLPRHPPVVVQQQRGVKDANHTIMPVDVNKRIIIESMRVEFGGVRPQAMCMFDKTQPSNPDKITPEIIDWQRKSYYLFRDALDEV